MASLPSNHESSNAGSQDINVKNSDFDNFQHEGRADKSSNALQSSLERLPNEMKVAVLASLPNLITLRNLTLAVPGFYVVYSNEKHRVLFHVLSNDLSPELMGELRTLHAARTIKYGRRWHNNMIRFLNDYLVDRRLGGYLDYQDDILELVKTHASIHRFIQGMCALSLSRRPNLDAPFGTILANSPLSSTEINRFYHAVYRYEISSTLLSIRFPFNPDEINDTHRQRQRKFIGAQLLESFSYCETEQMNCVRIYMTHCYKKLLEELSVGLGFSFGPLKSAKGHRIIAATPFSQFLFNYETQWFNTGARHCASLSLDLLERITTAPSRKEQLQLLKAHAFLPNMTFDDITNVIWYDINDRGFRHPEEVRNLNYVSEEEEGPTTGFVWSRDPILMDETYGWPQHPRPPNERWLWSWAYVMWDRERLDKWGVLRSIHSSFNGMISKFLAEEERPADLGGNED